MNNIIAGINFRELEYITLPELRGGGLTVGEIISELLPYIFSAAGILLLIYLVAGGFQFLTSAGDPGKTAAARAKITNGLIGLIIIFTAFWIVQLIAYILGIGQIAGPIDSIFRD